MPTSTPTSSPSGNLHGMPVRASAASARSADRDRRQSAGDQPSRCARSASTASTPAKKFVHDNGLEVFDMRYIDEMGMRHTMELALATIDANTLASASTSISSMPTSPRRRHHRQGRPDLSPGAALHGDDRRHRRWARST
jgi:arginase